MNAKELDEAIMALPPEPDFEFTECGYVIKQLDKYWYRRLALVLQVVREYTEAWDQDLSDDDLWEKSAEKRANLRTILQLEGA